MAVEDPGKFTVTCDECGDTTEMDSTQYAGDPDTWGVDDETIEDEGWVKKDGQILCGDCAKCEDDEE